LRDVFRVGVFYNQVLFGAIEFAPQVKDADCAVRFVLRRAIGVDAMANMAAQTAKQPTSRIPMEGSTAFLSVGAHRIAAHSEYAVERR
jgi:hypothetical protein